MILLTSTNDLLSVTTGGSQVVNVHVSWVGLNGTTVTPARQNTIISSAGTTTVVPSPGASTQYNVKAIIITNTDASTTVTISVKHTDGTNVITLISMPLTAGDTLTWTEDEGWAYLVNGSSQAQAAVLATTMSDFNPVEGSYNTGVQSQLQVDPDGNLEIRGPVHTDEGNFYDHFAGTSLTTALTGTLTFVNGSTNVTGVGTTFTTQIQAGQYIKLNADSETAYALVFSVQSNTQLTLASGYTGSSASGASVVSNWVTVTGSGGSFVVANSYCNITNGLGSGTKTYVYRLLDYAPLQGTLFGYVLGLVTGQTGWMGFVDNPANPVQQAIIQFGNGLPANQFYLITSGTGGATDTTTQLCTFPSNLPTGSIITFCITLSGNRVVVSIGSPNAVEPQVVATAVQDVPDPYTVMYGVVGLVNNSAIAASATIYADGVLIIDADRLEVSASFNGDPVQATLSAKNPTGLLQPVNADNNNAMQVTSSGFEDMTGVVRGSPAVTQLGATVNQNYSLGRVKIALGNVGQDRGDPDLDGGRGLPTENMAILRQQEMQTLVLRDERDSMTLRRASERFQQRSDARCGRDGRQ